jgi:hypothetical protein
MDIHQSQVDRNMGAWTFNNPRWTGTRGHGHSSVSGRQEHEGMGIHQYQVDRTWGHGHLSTSQVDRNMGSWTLISPR